MTGEAYSGCSDCKLHWLHMRVCVCA